MIPWNRLSEVERFAYRLQVEIMGDRDGNETPTVRDIVQAIGYAIANLDIDTRDGA